MEKIKNFINQLKENSGEPREGFGEYLKKCKPVNIPSSVPQFAIYWEIPEGEILHDVMIQPFYDGRALKARDTDVLVASYPKTGTTWTQEITYLIVHDGDFEKATSAPTEVRSPCIEIPAGGIRAIEEAEDPRLIKTHLPYELLPSSFIENKTKKIIYIARNPKDTIVSWYHFMTMVGYSGYNGTFEEFVDLFCSERLWYSSFARNVLSYWNRRHQENILFLFYEELQNNLKSSVIKIMKYLEKDLTDDQINRIVEHASFENMKKNPMANYSHGGAAIKMPDSKTDFLRKGKTGDWRNYFNDETNKKVDDYVEKHFKGSGIVFDYHV
ncbi:hypothetical protein CHUAL_008736 [Chamberlinius hualienensis]